MAAQILKTPIDYHALPGLSHSRLKLLRKNPKLFRQALDGGWAMETKKHHIDGTLIDLVLLDFERFQSEYVQQTWQTPSSPQQKQFAEQAARGVALEDAYDASYASDHKPETLRRKAFELAGQLEGYIDYLREDAEKIPYTSEQNDMVMAIQRNALDHPVISRLLGHNHAETHKIIRTELMGEQAKCEVDLFVDAGHVLWNVDVKSTKEYLGNFEREYRRYGYANQQAWYYKLIREQAIAAGRPHVRIETVCIAVEKNFPYSVGLFKPHGKLLVEGWRWCRQSVEIFKKHNRLGFEHLPRTYERGMELITPYNYES